MRCTIPEISWHNREPVLSVDISPILNEIYKLATGGGDSHVLIWQMTISDSGAIKQEIISDLTRHQRAVNAVRWSPTGEYLASADDDANIIIWQQKTDNIPVLEGDTGDKEIWIVNKILRGHKEDIYDICWSVNGLKVFSGSIDNTAIIWDIPRGKMEHILSDHNGFVQGVAWDPKDQVIVTISTDRICRLFDITGRQIKARFHKGRLPVPPTHYLYEKNIKYFHDDTFKSFFRRLQFSPDGSLLIVPSGHMETEDCKRTLNATLIFAMNNNCIEPAAVLPIPKQCSTVVRCCPLLFELRQDGPEPIINLPYRVIIAIGTDHDIILYDTQQLIPFARFQEVHYTRLTDLTWSYDGLLLIASSTDGFCSLITFDETELGVPYVKDDSEVEDNAMDVSGCEELLDIDENIDINNKDNKIQYKENKDMNKRTSFLEDWAIKTPKKIKTNARKESNTKDGKNVIEISDDDDDDDDMRELPKEIKEEINKLIPSRTSQKIEYGENKMNNKDVRPIAVRRKPKVNKGETVKQESKKNNTVLENKPSEIKKVRDQTDSIIQVKNLDTSIKINKSTTNEVVKTYGVSYSKIINHKNIIDKESHVECTKPTTEIVTKRENPKISVSSLSKKKYFTSPSCKQNQLLNFLHNPGDKCNNTKKSKRKFMESSNVNLILNEDDAQDAWKCKNDDKNCGPERNETINASHVEDCTEDFSLQLEDSESEKNVTNECKDRVPMNKTDFSTNQISKSEKVKFENDISDESSDFEKIGTEPSQQQKVPRRVTLITLSSPKGKKKEKP